MMDGEPVIDPLDGGKALLASPKPSLREVDSSELLCGESELHIRHGDELYRLKLTRNGKLILQK